MKLSNYFLKIFQGRRLSQSSGDAAKEAFSKSERRYDNGSMLFCLAVSISVYMPQELLAPSWLLLIFPITWKNSDNAIGIPYFLDINAYAERLVCFAREECLDHFVIFIYGLLQRLIKSYIEYNNNYRPHQRLKGIPVAPAGTSPKDGEIKRKPLLFGLHSHYYSEAAQYLKK